MADNASFFLGGEFGFGNSEFIEIQVAGFDKNRGSEVCEKMVADLVARWKSCKTIGGEDVGKFGEKVGDKIHFGVNRRVTQKKENGGEEVRHMEGEELLKPSGWPHPREDCDGGESLPQGSGRRQEPAEKPLKTAGTKTKRDDTGA